MKKLILFFWLTISNLYGQNQIIEFCDDSLKTFIYTTIGTPNCTYHWAAYQNDRLIQTSNFDFFEIQYKKEDQYRIEVYIENNLCQSEVKTFNILVIPCREPIILIPTAFTPNGDNLNDIFYVRESYIQEATVEIFNRWGELIFQTNNLSQGWDGQDTPSDMYVCKVTYKDIRGVNGIKYAFVILYR